MLRTRLVSAISVCPPGLLLNKWYASRGQVSMPIIDPSCLLHPGRSTVKGSQLLLADSWLDYDFEML